MLLAMKGMLLLGSCLLGEVTEPAKAPPVFRATITPELLQALQRTDWYGMYFKNKKLGYMKVYGMRLGEAEAPTYQLGNHFRAVFRSGAATLAIEASQEEDYEGRPPYVLQQGRYRKSLGETQQEVVVTRVGAAYRLTTTVKGKKNIKDLKSFSWTLADALAAAAWVRQRPPVGTRVVMPSLDWEEGVRRDLERRQLLARKTVQVRGVPLTYDEVEVYIPREKLRGLERWDAAGNLLSGQVGGILEVRLETEQQAKNLDAALDLFLLGLVKIDQPLGDPRQIRRLRLEARGPAASKLTSGSWQIVERDARGRILLSLGKEFARPEQATAEDQREHLRASVRYPADDPRIQALTRRALAGVQHPRDKVTRLVHFVHRYLRPSYRNKGLIVLDLLDKREGDCTAYAALFATLARAAGIPCREVSGLVYAGDDVRAFGGHAWNEVVLEGRWLPVDASCDEVEVDATHISFGSDLGGTVNLLETAGEHLTLHLLEVQRRPAPAHAP